MDRPRRARRPPQRYEPEPQGPFEDDLSGSDEGSDSDTGSDTDTRSDTSSDSDSGLSGFVVSDEECTSEGTECDSETSDEE